MTFPWSLVEFSRDAVALELAHSRQALSLAEVLPQQAIEVLVATALPGAMGIGEVAAHTGRFFQCPVAMELGAVVPGDGLERQAAGPD